MNRAAPHDLLTRAEKLVRRIDFHGRETLVFVNSDGFVDSAPIFTERAAALLRAQCDQRGFRVVGNYRPGVSVAQLAADVRETLK